LGIFAGWRGSLPARTRSSSWAATVSRALLPILSPPRRISVLTDGPASAAHHGGEFRPTEYLPLPQELTPSPLAFPRPVCPGHLFQDIHPDGAADKPFYNVTTDFSHDKAVADWTVAGLGEFDAQDNVLLLIAHDISVVDPQRFDFYPRPLNDWMEKGVGKKVRWLFLGDYEDALEAKKDGKEPFKWGKYP
jgi:hypothetical protein